MRIHAAAPRVFGAGGVELHRPAAEPNPTQPDGSLTTERFVAPNGETLVCVNHGPETNAAARVFLRNDTRAVCRLTITNETPENHTATHPPLFDAGIITKGCRIN